MGDFLGRLGPVALHSLGSEGILLAEGKISYFRDAPVDFGGLRFWFAQPLTKSLVAHQKGPG